MNKQIFKPLIRLSCKQALQQIETGTIIDGTNALLKGPRTAKEAIEMSQLFTTLSKYQDDAEASFVVLRYGGFESKIDLKVSVLFVKNKVKLFLSFYESRQTVSDLRFIIENNRPDFTPEELRKVTAFIVLESL